ASSSREAATAIRAADAQAERAQADWKRYASLVEVGTVPRREAERVRAEAVSAAAESDRVRAALTVSRDGTLVAGRRRAELVSGLEQARAAEARAQAALDLALQDQAASVIRAPITSVVTDRQAQTNNYV